MRSLNSKCAKSRRHQLEYACNLWNSTDKMCRHFKILTKNLNKTKSIREVCKMRHTTYIHANVLYIHIVYKHWHQYSTLVSCNVTTSPTRLQYYVRLDCFCVVQQQYPNQYPDPLNYTSINILVMLWMAQLSSNA